MMKACEEADEAAAEPPKEAAAPAALPAASYTVGGATSNAGYSKDAPTGASTPSKGAPLVFMLL